MNAPALMVGASLLFAVMGVCVKLASELVKYSGAPERVSKTALIEAQSTAVARATASICNEERRRFGRTSGCGGMLHKLSALYGAGEIVMYRALVGGAVLMPCDPKHGRADSHIDSRLVAAVMTGFVGAALVLRPTIEQQQVWHGLIGLGSGMIAAMAYLQVTALGRVGEPEARVVLYFSLSGVLVGAGFALFTGGFHGHTVKDALLLLAIGTLATGAQWMITRAYGTGATLGIAALQYLGIVFSFAFGLLIFDEQLTGLAAVGVVLIIGAGVAATLLRNRARAPSDTVTPTES